jgi:hypothetical protein
MSFLLKINLYHGLTSIVNRIIDDSMNKKEIIDWLDWNDVRNTYPKWLWVANGVVIVIALLVILFV